MPPPAVKELVERAGILVSSDVRRAVESARALAPNGEMQTSSLFREFELAPPDLGRVRLPLAGWAVAYGVRMLFRAHEHITPEEHLRAQEAAAFLADLAEKHESVAVVTHATFRSVVAGVLRTNGWQLEIPRRRSAHWSTWILRTSGHHT
jgi:broad specificity phosphatase PhoE